MVLKSRKMHGFNRWYLLCTAVVSVLLPLFHFSLFHIPDTGAAAFSILQVMGTSVMEPQPIVSGSNGFSVEIIFRYVYVAVALAMLIALVVRVLWIYHLKHKFGAEKMPGFWLVKAPLRAAPFSFMNILFWKDSIPFETDEGKRILAHEFTHIKQYHTLDKLLVQVVLACCWLNPCLWQLRKELWLQHEFIADDQAIADGDADAFARMLLHAEYSSLPLSAGNSFYHSPIKRRLMMLTQSNRTKYAPLRRLLVLPLVMLTVFIFAFTIDNGDTGVTRASRTVTLVLDASHGGKDPGGIGENGQTEKDLTLKICGKLTALAAAYNIRIIPTREADIYYTPEDRVGKSNAADADLFLSIHVNKSTADDPRGNEYELGVSPKNANYKQSLTLASAVVPRLKSAGITGRIVEAGGIHVLKANKHPALLLECGNIDDADNMIRLASDEKLESMCRSLLSAIVDYQASLSRRK
jgi:N-acetylmuramoyl-L-alanine amidase